MKIHKKLKKVKNMKKVKREDVKIILGIIIIFLIMLGINAKDFVSDTSSPNIRMNVESITPFPVEPGQDFTLQLRIFNDGKERAEKVSINYIKNKAIIFTGKEDNFDDSFLLCSKCSRENIYHFSVLPNIKSGEYPLTFKIKNGNYEYEKKVLIKVIGQPDIIFNANILSNEISPDGDFYVNLKIKNAGTGEARNIKVVPMTDGFVMKNSNLIFIDEIKPGQVVDKKVHFIVSDSKEPGPYKIKFLITYKDELSKVYNFEEYLGVNLLNSIKLDISEIKIDPNPIKEGEKIKVIIRIENLGEGDADNIQIRLESDAFKGQKKTFVGKLKEDEDAPAIFSLIPTKDGKQDLKIIVSYEDDLGKHETSEDLNVLIKNKRDENSKFIVIFIAILIVIEISYFLLKKNKRKN